MREIFNFLNFGKKKKKWNIEETWKIRNWKYGDPLEKVLRADEWILCVKFNTTFNICIYGKLSCIRMKTVHILSILILIKSKKT